jgi:3-oxoacyl-[acyl-carrier-protein] synthase-3
MDAYITALSAFLPGTAVDNEAIDLYLGRPDRISARTRKMILASNGITTRYYAIDPESGRPTYTNARLAARAVEGLGPRLSRNRLHCLCCGTSSPDQMMPGHASMVHGELDIGPCEVVSTAGVCLTGISALKYGAMAVALGLAENAVATGSELASSYMRADFFAKVGTGGSGAQENEHPAFSFEENFLRWMLSDGAGAVLIENKPAESLSLQIEGIEIMSLAHRLPACMFAGCVRNGDGELQGWRDIVRQGLAAAGGVFTVKQDAKLLNREVLPALVGEGLPPVIEKYGLRPEDIDWFLPHYSSEYFRQPLFKQLTDIGFAIPQDRWFTNLSDKGNTGSASFFIMLEELVRSGRLQRGHRVLGLIPESGRFSVGYVLLRAV